MSDQPKPAEPIDSRIEVALRDYLERLDRGEPVDPEKFLSQHPEIADELRSVIAAEAQLRRMAAGEATPEPADTSTRSFALHGQETIAPQARVKRAGESGQGALKEQFGRYRILSVLGQGAMGRVYLAEDTQLKRQVALKTPHFEKDPSGELLERLYREARAAATLRHPNICPVYDVGQIEGTHYISMAYIEGHPLSAFIRAAKPQPERQILIVIRKLAQALQEAHDQKVVHRDLKPANIMVDKRGEPLIMDFGLARQVRAEEEIRLTHSGMLVGTPAYMSPEQVNGEPDKIGPLTDEYSLGVILYELLTGHLPFRGSMMAVLGQIVTKDAAPPSQGRPGLDPRIGAACLKMMAKNPTDRFPSLTAVAEELAIILENPGARSAATGKSAGTFTLPIPADAQPAAEAGSSRILKSQKQRSLTGSDLTSLEELARKCLTRHDYDQAIQIAERIPEEKRNAGLQTLLEKARSKQDEIAFLICDIDEAVRLKDFQTALRKAEALRKIKPGHHRALEVQQQFGGERDGGVARLGSKAQLTQAWSEGGWIPWTALAFGLAVVGGVSALIILWLGKTAIVIDAKDPGIKVEVKDGTALITVPGKQSIKVAPGDQQIKVSYAGLETQTRSFTLKSGQTKTLTVAIMNSQLVARLENEISEQIPDPDKKPLAQKGGDRGPENERQRTLALARLAQRPGKKKAGAAPMGPRPPLLVAPFDGAAAQNARQQWSVYLKQPAELTTTIGMKLLLIPPGQFLMGSPKADRFAAPAEQPKHEVRITKPYYLDTHEVTRGEFAKFVAATGYKTEAEKEGTAGGFDSKGELGLVHNTSWRKPGFDPGFEQTDSHPVVIVSWNDATAFCRWLSQSERQTYRLPTEAEWEYACRAGTPTWFSSGNWLNDLFKAGNGLDETFREHFHLKATDQRPHDGYVFTAPVGSFPPNHFGLFDMHGNVWEWCQDWFGPTYASSPATDPTGPTQGLHRVARGGAFDCGLAARSAARDALQPAVRMANLGFRIVRETADSSDATAAPVEQAAAEGDPSVLAAPFDSARAKRGQQWWADHIKLPVQVDNAIGMKLVLIPPGEFQMGSDDARLPDDTRPIHRVRITKPHYMGAYEVTQEEFQRVMNTNASHFKDDPKLPVEQVSLDQMQDFCRKLNDAPEERRAGRHYRLPTEAEWEFACRAGTQTLFYFGDSITAGQANFDGTQPWLGLPPGKNLGHTTKVGSYSPNAFGLFDMHGNVAEQVSDPYAPSYDTQVVEDPKGAASGKLTIARGGAWMTPATPSAYRFPGPWSSIGPQIGFRVVCDISKPLTETPATDRNQDGLLIAPFDESTAKTAQQQWSGRLKTPPELKNSIAMQLRLIPPGQFQMGSDHSAEHVGPAHSVRITRPFYLGTYEVTRGEFGRFAAATRFKTDAERAKGGWRLDNTEKHSKFEGKHPYTWHKPGFPQKNSHPVINVTWDDARQFCDWLSRKEGKTYRLPTEAEWEYACRAGTTGENYSGTRREELTQIGNVADASVSAKFSAWTAVKSSDGFVFTSPVGQFHPNNFGLYDTLGNAMEWCSDWFDKDYYKQSPESDPPGPRTGRFRIARGGGFDDLPEASGRWEYHPDHHAPDVGFRVVCEISLGQAAGEGAATVTRPAAGDGRHVWLGRSRFENIGAGKWRETVPKEPGHAIYFFHEVARTPQYLELFDKTRIKAKGGVSVRLEDNQALMRWGGPDKDFKLLQRGQWVTTTERPAPNSR